MFERLNKSHQEETSTLSLQRRMRPHICDLTRNIYADLVAISDDPRCSTQSIASGRSSLVQSCQGAGREVPGVLPNVFFWSHGGKQTKASVGMSRENKVEAQMVGQLCSYLCQNGVPAQSIAVLTPYKVRSTPSSSRLFNLKSLQKNHSSVSRRGK